MAKVTRIKAKDDAPKKTKTTKTTKTALAEKEPVRKVSVKAKNSENKKVAKSRLEQQAERDLEMREKDRAERQAIKDAYRAERAKIKAQLKQSNKSVSKAERKALKKKVKHELKDLKKAHRDEHPGYFRGSIREIRQVRWPSRKDTWRLTLAVIGYVILMAVCLTLLDALLKLIFNKVIGGNM